MVAGSRGTRGSPRRDEPGREVRFGVHARDPRGGARGLPRCLHAGGPGGARGAGAARPRAARADGPARRAAPRARVGAAADRVPRSEDADRAYRTHGRRRPRRQLRRRRDSARPRAPVDPGHRPGHPAARAGRPGAAQHRLRAAVGRRRLDVRRRGRPRPGRDHGARQPAQPEAGDRRDAHLPRRGRPGRGRDERVGARFLRPADRRGLAPSARVHHPHLPGTRAPPGRPPRPPLGGRRLLGVDRRPRALRGEQPRGAARRGALDRALPAQDPDRRGGRVLEPAAGRARAPPRAAGRDDQGLRPGRADRGELPADGDPRRAGAPLRRLQHRPLGLHQQRRRRARLGPRVRQPEHRRDRDDLRLHARLRGPRAPGGQHARPQRPLRALAGRDGDQHPGRQRGGRGGRHEAGRRRRRARAARGRERQVGRPLEDGPHRAAGLGARGPDQPARPEVRAAHLHGGRRGGAEVARAGAAHGARGARPALRRAPVRQRLRSGFPGRRAQARRLLRRRRRCST